MHRCYAVVKHVECTHQDTHLCVSSQERCVAHKCVLFTRIIKLPILNPCIFVTTGENVPNLLTVFYAPTSHNGFKESWLGGLQDICY